MNNSNIRTYLFDKLSAITDIPPIKEEVENFKPKSNADVPFIRFTFMPAEAIQQELADNKLSGKGLVRVDLFYSRSLNNTDTILTMADSITDEFTPEVIQLSDKQLTIEASWPEQIRTEESFINLPIFVRWNTYET